MIVKIKLTLKYIKQPNVGQQQIDYISSYGIYSFTSVTLEIEIIN